MSGTEAERQRTWRPDWPCSVTGPLRPLRRGAGDPTFRIDDAGQVWRGTRTPEGPATLRVGSAPSDGEVRASAWGPGADWVLDSLPGLLGAHDDWSGFEPRHPVLEEARRRHPHLRTGRTGLVMEALVPAMGNTLVLLGLSFALALMIALPFALSGAWWTLYLTGTDFDRPASVGLLLLIGIVVNNAILLVDRTRRAEAEGLTRRDAVASAVRQRARPIYMSALTSIFGMLPLMLMPGTGSEIYRGLAAIIVGGMVSSAIFTLVLLPSLLRFGEDRHGIATNIPAPDADPARSGG